jgi:hypothetical protein
MISLRTEGQNRGRKGGRIASWIRAGLHGAKDILAARWHGLSLEWYSLRRLEEGIKKYGGPHSPIPLEIRKLLALLRVAVLAAEEKLITTFFEEETLKAAVKKGGRNAGALSLVRRVIRGVTKERQYLEFLRDILSVSARVTSGIEWSIRKKIEPIMLLINARLSILSAKPPSKAKGTTKAPSKAKTKTPPKAKSPAKATVKPKSPAKVKTPVKAKSPSKKKPSPPKPKAKTPPKKKAAKPKKETLIEECEQKNLRRAFLRTPEGKQECEATNAEKAKRREAEPGQDEVSTDEDCDNISDSSDCDE